jgi:hypothetical protein
MPACAEPMASGELEGQPNNKADQGWWTSKKKRRETLESWKRDVRWDGRHDSWGCMEHWRGGARQQIFGRSDHGRPSSPSLTVLQGVGTSVWILASCQSVVLLLTE